MCARLPEFHLVNAPVSIFHKERDCIAMNESRSRSWILQHVWAGFPPRTCIIHDISDFRYTCRRVQLPLTKYQFCCCNKNTISTKTRTTGGIDKNVISSRQRWIVKFIWELQSHVERRFFSIIHPWVFGNAARVYSSTVRERHRNTAARRLYRVCAMYCSQQPRSHALALISFRASAIFIYV